MAPFEIPQVTQADILGFQETHFSLHAIASFDSQFLQPLGHEAEKYHDGNETADYIDEDDDGLGYYADGVKRTLTDEQIAIFRHSELEALKRAARGTASQRRSSPAETEQLADAKDLEDGEVLGPPTDADTSSSSKKRKNRKKAAKNRRTEEKKPDLRKRTWDVVDSGLESLDYDEMESAPKMRINPSQRRQISYDDG